MKHCNILDLEKVCIGLWLGMGTAISVGNKTSVKGRFSIRVRVRVNWLRNITRVLYYLFYRTE